jgi:hypothetical protein
MNYDTDLDPANEMVIDPIDPFADLIASPNRNNHAIMSNRPCDGAVSQVCAENFTTELTNDDVGGRDVLYPLPEPSRLALLASGGCLISALARVRRAHHRHATAMPNRSDIGIGEASGSK